MHGKSMWSTLLGRRKINMPKDMRLVAILPTLLKLYCAVLLKMVQGSLDNLCQWQFAFRPKRQCHDVVFVLRMLIEKSIEWRQPIFIADGDLPKAYDNVKHSLDADASLTRASQRSS